MTLYYRTDHPTTFNTHRYPHNNSPQYPDFRKKQEETAKNYEYIKNNIKSKKPEDVTERDLQLILKVLHQDSQNKLVKFKIDNKENMEYFNSVDTAWYKANKNVYSPKNEILPVFLKVRKEIESLKGRKEIESPDERIYKQFINFSNVHTFWELAKFFEIHELVDYCGKVILNPHI